MTTMDAIKEALERIVLNPKYHPYLALLKAARNGLIYGAKVRFPHALVMVFLFRSGTLRSKLALIYKATRTHALNLARFAVLYKTTLLLLSPALLSALTSHPKTLPSSPPSIPPTTQPRSHIPYAPRPDPRPNPLAPSSLTPLVAGLVGGYYVFGRAMHSSVNQQIVTYIFARCCLALAQIAFREDGGVVAEGILPGGSKGEAAAWVRRNAWKAVAAGSWGTVMWIFRWYPEALLPSLRSSMVYIYSDCDNWDSLRNFLVYNK